MNYKRLALSLLLPQLAGLVGSIFTISAIPNWYATLEKPGFTPPDWLFGPVWVTLYLLMGISVYLIWQKLEENQKAKAALWLFWIHLIFNFIWSIIFFGLQNPGLAFVNIVILWIMILVLIIKFWEIDKRAAFALVPYLAWVTLASFLNYYIWILN